MSKQRVSIDTQPWGIEVEEMTGRSFITWAQHRAFEVKLRGYAEQAVARLNAHDELVAALALMVKLQTDKALRADPALYSAFKVAGDALAKVSA